MVFAPDLIPGPHEHTAGVLTTVKPTVLRAMLCVHKRTEVDCLTCTKTELEHGLSVSCNENTLEFRSHGSDHEDGFLVGCRRSSEHPADGGCKPL